MRPFSAGTALGFREYNLLCVTERPKGAMYHQYLEGVRQWQSSRRKRKKLSMHRWTCM